MLPDTAAGARARGNTPAKANPGASLQQDALAIISDLRAQMEQVANRVFDEKIRNRRPGGADSWDFNAVEGADTPCGMAYIPYPAYIESVALGSSPTGNVYWDFRVARPGYDLTAPVSVVDGGVSLIGGTMGTALPSSTWIRPIEAGSWVLAYCTYMDSKLSCAALVIRCL